MIPLGATPTSHRTPVVCEGNVHWPVPSREMARLEAAAAAVKAVPLIVLHDGERLHFLGGEPTFTTDQAIQRRKAR
jgi:hypothetical protein